MIPIQKTQFKLPFFDSSFQLSALNKKVLSVACASILLLGVQLSLPWLFTLEMTCLITSLTYFCEKILRTEKNDWFNCNFEKKELIFWCSFFILRPFIIQIICFAFGIPLPPVPQEGIVEWILNHPLKAIPIATILAPVSEEILFRGFLLEQLEGLAKLCKLPEELGKKLSDVIQAGVFGALHLNRKIKESYEIATLLILSLFGYMAAVWKRKENSLIAPIALHSSNNVSAVAHILMSPH